MKKSALALILGFAALLVWSAPGALAAVALKAPSTTAADQPASFSVRAADSTSVAFAVDGRTQWTKHTGGREFRRAGAINLPAGRHQLEARATNSRGQDSVTKQTVTVKAPSKSSGSSKGSSSGKGNAASGTGGSTGTSTSSGGSGSTIAPVTTVPTAPVTTPTAPTVPTAPTQPTTPTTPSQPPTGTNPNAAAELLFSANKISGYLNQSAPGAVTEVPDPAGSGESAFQMTVNNADVAPITPTENPRAELVSEPIFHSGSEFWASSKFYLPASFPSSVPGWLTLLEGPFGEPWTGTPPWHIEVSGSSIQWSRNETYGWDVPWKMPLVRGSWVSVMLHERYAHDGWIEMWIDGQPITFFASGGANPSHVAPTTKLAMETMDASTDEGPGSIHLMNYRQVGMFQTVTVDEGGLKIGKSRASVEN